MKSKTLELACDRALAATLGEALTAYAHAAYPAGGSDCAQVARETLLETARQCAAHQDGGLSVRKRQLAQIRAAVKWYCSENPALDAANSESLLTLLGIECRD